MRSSPRLSQALTVDWPYWAVKPALLHRCTALQHRLAAAGRQGARLRQPGHLLATAACLAAGRRVEQLHHRLLDWLGDDGQIDWSRASLDSVAMRAKHSNQRERAFRRLRA